MSLNEPMSSDKPLRIRNSTAEFLIFTRQAGDEGIEVRVAEETVWLTQKLMAVLFDVTVPTVSEHLTNLFQQGEIEAGATVRKFRIVQTEGTREVGRNVDFYNLDAIIAVGFRVNSARATQFRQWATGVLRDFAIHEPQRINRRRRRSAVLHAGCPQADRHQPLRLRGRLLAWVPGLTMRSSLAHADESPVFARDYRSE